MPALADVSPTLRHNAPQLAITINRDQAALRHPPQSTDDLKRFRPAAGGAILHPNRGDVILNLRPRAWHRSTLDQIYVKGSVGQAVPLSTWDVDAASSARCPCHTRGNSGSKLRSLALVRMYPLRHRIPL